MDKVGHPCPECKKGRIYPVGWWSKLETESCKRWKCIECGCEEIDD